MVYWYSIVSVVIVGTAVVGSVYLLWNKERRQNCTHHQQLNRSLLYQHENDDDGACWPRSQQLWTSCWRGLHPGVLLGFRFVSFVVLALFLLLDIRDWDASIFIYYTEWTYSLVMMYFAIGSVVSAHGCWLYHKHNDIFLENVEESQGRGDPEQNPTKISAKEDFIRLPAKLQRRQFYREQDALRAGFWGHFMQISYQISAGAAFLTDIIFWCIIVPFSSNAHLGLNLLTGCIHSTNVVFMLLETSINDLPFPWFRLAYFVLWSSVYVIFQWLIHFCGFTRWPYPFLKLSTPLAPLWYLILAAFHVACYGMYALIVKAKDSLFSKLFPHSYLRPY